jgi:serine/threonine protein kinase
VFPQIFGKYVLERELAAGGMARVYLATLRGAVGFEKRLVVKQIRPELASDQAFVRRFVEEAKTTVDLSHPNIVPVYELGVEQGVYYIAMELCAGVTLAEILAHTGPLRAEEGAYLGVEICRALDYAHRRAGVVHRDVTPRNVLIDEEGAVRLIDFGIAAPVTDSGSGSGEIFGSPGHMPPEQMSGKALSPATDVFAVAALLVEAWTGRAPFRRKTARASEAALSEPVPPLSDATLEPLAALISRGLSLDPAARPAHAELLARPLRDFLRNVDAGDVARRLGQRVQQSARRMERGDLLAASQSKKTATGDDPARISSVPASSGGRIETHTFAAREEVSEWTRRLGSGRESDPPPSVTPAAARELDSTKATPTARTESARSRRPESGPSTRKLPSMPPAAAESPPEGSGLEASMNGAADERSEPSRAGASGFTGPVESMPQNAAHHAPARRRAALLLALAGTALVLGVGVFGPRRATNHGSAASLPAAIRPILAELPVASVTLRPPPRAQTLNATTSGAAAARAVDYADALRRDPDVKGAPSASAKHTAAPATGGAAPPSPTTPASTSSHDAAGSTNRGAPLSATVAEGVLRVTADPPAGVSLQGPSGTRAFTTPASDLKLPPGVYVLTFRNDTYGEPVVTRVTLEAGASRSVHVDFREAEPRVSIR